MQDRDRGNVGEGQKQTRPFRTIISSIIWRYCLLCGGVAVASGYIVLVGTLAEEFSEKIIRNFSFTLAFLAALALVVGVPVIALSGFIQSKTSGDVSRIGARIFSDVIVGSFALLLLLVLLAFGILLLQLSTGQFLLGEEETQYRHLMMLSAYAGALFGVAAGWKGKSSHWIGFGSLNMAWNKGIRGNGLPRIRWLMAFERTVPIFHKPGGVEKLGAHGNIYARYGLNLCGEFVADGSPSPGATTTTRHQRANSFSCQGQAVGSIHQGNLSQSRGIPSKERIEILEMIDSGRRGCSALGDGRHKLFSPNPPKEGV